MIYLQLFFEFLKTGLFTIGGGLAAIPLLQEMADNTGWFTQAQLADMLAISESTPGPIGINMATYVGYTTAGFPGGLIATLAIITPSLIIVLIVARLLRGLRDNVILESALYGLRPASIGLISAAGLGIIRLSLIREELWRHTGEISDLFDFKAIILALVLFFLMKKFKIPPIVFIAGSAAIGIIFKF